jgi:glycosyltransferase involved in cell wall biosynthesis
MRKKVLVRGPILTRSGYGEHARFILRALQTIEDKVDIYAIPINWGATGWTTDIDDERRWMDFIIQKTAAALKQGMKDFDATIQVSIPNEWEKLAPVNIGVTAGIETTKVAVQWLEKGNLVDHIIVPSDHSAQVYRNTSYDVVVNDTQQEIKGYKCTKPISVVSYPVKEFNTEDLTLDLETDFNFLSVAQWGPRKNLENSIRWFVEEFIDQNVGLVVKTNFIKNSLIDRNKCIKSIQNLLSNKNYANRKCKIYLLHGEMNDKEMHSLYNDPKIKAFISTTHGEGFGLPFFEAAYEGLPVIAPDWSGYVDFLHMPVENKKGKIRNKPMYGAVDFNLQQIAPEAAWEGVVEKDSLWCYADQGSFKIKMREVYKDYGRFAKQAKQLQAHIKKSLSEENQNKKITDIILDTILASEQKNIPLEVQVFE